MAVRTAGDLRNVAKPLPPATLHERELADRVRRHVHTLATVIGPRSLRQPDALQRAGDYIEQELRRAGHSPQDQPFAAAGRQVRNIEVELPGTATPERIVIVGAHYDTIPTSPGANDNGSGVAALLELAREYSGLPQPSTVRFVAFVNEEPPYFMTAEMGSLVYAQRCKQRSEHIAAMYSLETIGYYSTAEGSQQYPAPFHLLFPSTGHFIAMVSNFRSTALLRRTLAAFRSRSTLPAIGSPAPEGIPGVGWSDHQSFWRQGFPALMLTDTAPFRYPYYHSGEDTPDKLDYEAIGRLVCGMTNVIARVAE